MSQSKQTLGNTDLGYFLGTLHLTVSQNIEILWRLYSVKIKLFLPWIFEKCWPTLGCKCNTFWKLIGNINWLWKSHMVPRIFLNKNNMWRGYFWKEENEYKSRKAVFSDLLSYLLAPPGICICAIGKSFRELKRIIQSSSLCGWLCLTLAQPQL